MKKSQNAAAPFIATRAQHLAELAEDYVEIIYDLLEEKREARVCDIAKQFGVSHVTVIRALDRLKKRNFIQTCEEKGILLTTEGSTLAKACKKRHQFLLHYLTALGVPEDVAKIDVEGMEHHISPITMQAFKKQLEFMEKTYV